MCFSWRKSTGIHGWRPEVKASWSWRPRWWRSSRRTSFRRRSSLMMMSSEPWIHWGASKTGKSWNTNCCNPLIILVSRVYAPHLCSTKILRVHVRFAEKVIYFLLLDRKKRKPSHEDDTEVIVRNRCGSQDPPRKRIDSYNKNGISYTELSQGSPITPRRKLYK